MREKRSIYSNWNAEWPDGKDFAFTIFDDSDYASVQNVSRIYSLLNDFGFRITKSVWPMKGLKKPVCGGQTLQDTEYLNWIKILIKSGFEIGYHLGTYHSSTREETRLALDEFQKRIGYYPASGANHTGCSESIYWGNHRLSGINAVVYNILTRFRRYNKYSGHIESDALFWGDLCKKNIKYFRNFVFSDINTLKMCPFMPYHDPLRPYVNYWFASSEGPAVNSFNRCISEENQDRLEEEGGACIMYSHLAAGFYENQEINPRFRFLMERLSKKNGWFVPVAKLLDYLLEKNGHHEITGKQRQTLERKWLRNKIWIGTS
jgi:hypothetical protein